MSDPKGMEEQLHKHSDVEVEKTVTDLFSSLKNGLNNAFPSQWPNNTDILLGKKDNQIIYSLGSILEQCQLAVIKRMRPRAREDKIKAFIAKVDSLDDQLDELRDEINYSDR